MNNETLDAILMHLFTHLHTQTQVFMFYGENMET